MGSVSIDGHRPRRPLEFEDLLRRVTKALDPRLGPEEYILLLLPPAFALNFWIVQCNTL